MKLSPVTISTNPKIKHLFFVHKCVTLPFTFYDRSILHPEQKKWLTNDLFERAFFFGGGGRRRRRTIKNQYLIIECGYPKSFELGTGKNNDCDSSTAVFLRSLVRFYCRPLSIFVDLWSKWNVDEAWLYSSLICNNCSHRRMFTVDNGEWSWCIDVVYKIWFNIWLIFIFFFILF